MARKTDDNNIIWWLALAGLVIYMATKRNNQPAGETQQPDTVAPPLPTAPAVVPSTATPGFGDGSLMTKQELEDYQLATGNTDLKKQWTNENPVDFLIKTAN